MMVKLAESGKRRQIWGIIYLARVITSEKFQYRTCIEEGMALGSELDLQSTWKENDYEICTEHDNYNDDKRDSDTSEGQ